MSTASALLIIGLSLFLTSGVLGVSKLKKIPFVTLISLLGFGIALSIPFLLQEHWGTEVKFYWVLAAFIAVELSILFFEKHVRFFHDLVHHNIRELRILSFILMGVGFTVSEVGVTIGTHTGGIGTLLPLLPLKIMFGIFIHTVLTSLSSLMHVGALFTESALEAVFRFLNYYLRIALLSISHTLYIAFTDYHFSLYVLPFIALNLVFFFSIKNHLDKRNGWLPE